MAAEPDSKIGIVDARTVNGADPRLQIMSST
jgi:hypothetical protein